MRRHRRRIGLLVYASAVVVAGGGALVWAVGEWQGMEVGIWELALFIGLAGVLDVMVVPLAGGGGVAASFAVFFAGLLVLGAGPTACVAALAGVWSEGMVRRTPGLRTSFNAAHSVLSLVAAGWVYGALGGEVGQVSGGRALPGVVGAAVCLWLLETGWVSVAVALERGGRVWGRLRASLGPMLALDGALASVGLLLALLYESGWQLVGERGGRPGWPGALFLGGVVMIPSALLYYAYRLQGYLHQVYAQSLRTLGALMEAKLEGSQPGHGERVAALAAEMAQELELPPGQVEQIRYAGYLHDIGKVGVPAALLTRSRDAFSGEPAPVRLHPQIGAQILAPVRFLGVAAEIVRAHHERWDGLGYPEGLREGEIPVGAQLLALADAYVSRVSSAAATPDSTAGTPLPERALAQLRQAAGSRFDPQLIGTLALLETRPGTTAGLIPQPEASLGPSLWR